MSIIVDSMQIQKDEIDALESIYLNEVDVIRQQYPFKFAIKFRPYLDNMLIDDEAMIFQIIVDFGKDYPNEIPHFQVLPSSLLNQTQMLIMELKAKEIAESFNGEPMVFEVIENFESKIYGKLQIWLQKNIVDEQIRLKYFGLKDELVEIQDDLDEQEIELKGKKGLLLLQQQLNHLINGIEHLYVNLKLIQQVEMEALNKDKKKNISHQTGRQFFNQNQGLPIDSDDSQASDDEYNV